MSKSAIRPVREVWRSQPTMEGAGVRLRRAFGYHQVPRLDPFLMLDSFGSGRREDYEAGFPWHPHRGIETITYMREGEVEHGDSMGNKGVIGPGGIQWMTAGSGIIHQEMPRGDAKGRNAGFQLWSNLPKRAKMMDPRYQELTGDQVPVVTTKSGATVRVVAGEVEGTKGPVTEILTEPDLLDVTLAPGSTFTHAVRPGHTAFAYVFEGGGFFDRERDALGEEAVQGSNTKRGVDETELVVWGDGDEVVVETEDKPVRFLFAAGRPLGEPIAWAGPIVMNTDAEVRLAFREFRQGTFVKRK